MDDIAAVKRADWFKALGDIDTGDLRPLALRTCLKSPLLDQVAFCIQFCVDVTLPSQVRCLQTRLI